MLSCKHHAMALTSTLPATIYRKEASIGNTFRSEPVRTAQEQFTDCLPTAISHHCHSISAISYDRDQTLLFPAINAFVSDKRPFIAPVIFVTVCVPLLFSMADVYRPLLDFPYTLSSLELWADQSELRPVLGHQSFRIFR